MKNQILTLLALVLLVVTFVGCNSAKIASKENELFTAQELFSEPARPVGQKDAIELRTDPIDTVRIAFIGLGMRGSGAVRRYTFLEGVKVVALCDIVPEKVEEDFNRCWITQSRCLYRRK